MTGKETGSYQPSELQASLEFQMFRCGREGEDLKERRNLEEDEEALFPAKAKRPIRARLLDEVEVKQDYPTGGKVTLKKVVRLQFGTNVLGINEQGQLEQSPMYLLQGSSANFIPFAPRGKIPDISPMRITNLREYGSFTSIQNEPTSDQPSPKAPSGFPAQNAAGHRER